MKDYRYIFEQYTTKKDSRFTCPSCGTDHSFTRFIDTETGERLPEHFGKCNRTGKCNYFESPTPKKLKDWKPTDPIKKPVKKVEEIRAYLPPQLIEKSMGNDVPNSFIEYLGTFLTKETISSLAKRFQIGQFSIVPGACVFWYQDQLGTLHGGQAVTFDKAGHTVREILADGSRDRKTKWIHFELAKAYQNAKKDLPKWLKDYLKFKKPSAKFFGLHQLAQEDQSKPVAIVEAPKTAIIASAYFPELIWIASGTLGNLTYNRMKDLKDRKIVLYPDKGFYDDWKKKADLWELEFSISVSGFIEGTDVEPGGDLADYLPRFNPEDFQPTNNREHVNNRLNNSHKTGEKQANLPAIEAGTQGALFTFKAQEP